MLLGHRKLSAWYQQLAQHLDAGIPLAAALRASQGTGAPTHSLATMAETIERGGSVDDALRSARGWLPLPDLFALTAAAHAGRMPRTLRNLAARHEQIGTTKLRLLLASLYPLGILHFGLLLLPVVRMIDWEKGFQWSTLAYVRTLAFTLVPLWGIAIVIVILARRQNVVLAKIVGLLPAIGNYIRTQALADFSFTLGNLLEAGVPIGKAWATSGLITTSTPLKSAAVTMEHMVEQGRAPGTVLDATPGFPPDFVALYRTGESTGQLEGNLLKLATQYQEAANRALGVATVIYPMLVFLIVAAGIAYFVISIYAGYLKALGKLAE
jgi:type II secretory pathway component PulF